MMAVLTSILVFVVCFFGGYWAWAFWLRHR